MSCTQLLSVRAVLDCRKSRRIGGALLLRSDPQLVFSRSHVAGAWGLFQVHVVVCRTFLLKTFAWQIPRQIQNAFVITKQMQPKTSSVIVSIFLNKANKECRSRGANRTFLSPPGLPPPITFDKDQPHSVKEAPLPGSFSVSPWRNLCFCLHFKLVYEPCIYQRKRGNHINSHFTPCSVGQPLRTLMYCTCKRVFLQ